MQNILWTPIHTPTPDQLFEICEKFSIGEIDYLSQVSPDLFAALKNAPNDWDVLIDLAVSLEEVCMSYRWIVLPISSPAFMYVFASKCSHLIDIKVLFAHSERVSVEEIQKDGSILKKSTFQHIGFFGAALVE